MMKKANRIHSSDNSAFSSLACDRRNGEDGYRSNILDWVKSAHKNMSRGENYVGR